MKNLLPLTAVFLFTISAAAQKITPASITGTWKMTAAEMFGNYVDFKLRKITFSEEWKAANDAQTLAMAEKEMMGQMTVLESMTFLFTETTMKMSIEGTPDEEMTYTIIERDGRQYLQTPDDPTDSPEIKLANGVLEMHMDSEDGPVTMIFKKA